MRLDTRHETRLSVQSRGGMNDAMRRRRHAPTRPGTSNPAEADATYREIAEPPRRAGPALSTYARAHRSRALQPSIDWPSTIKDPNAVRLATLLHDVVLRQPGVRQREERSRRLRPLSTANARHLPLGVEVDISHPDDEDARSRRRSRRDGDAGCRSRRARSRRRRLSPLRRRHSPRIRLGAGGGVSSRPAAGAGATLAKPAIFRLLHPLEAAARRNLAAEIERLR